MPVDPDPTLPTFGALGVPKPLTRALERAGISHPSAVQAAVLPDALAGRNVLGKAATGSGKTLAFGLPVLARLAGRRSRPSSPRALVIVPTRELAGQVHTALEPLAAAVGLKLATVYGGTPYDKQIKRLRAGVDVVVATPGRLEDLIARRSCRLDDVEVVVLDEADHLCDLGFYPAVSRLVAMTPDGGQRLLLSATLDGDVNRLVRQHVADAVTHEAEEGVDAPDIEHHVLVAGTGSAKVDSAAALLRSNPRSIVFTRTRRGATALATGLAKRGIRTVDLHGSLSQRAREKNLRKFSSGHADVIVATDVAARGIHVDGIAFVVHYDAPTEHKAFLHRSGRTARAGNSGTVVTMTSEGGVHDVTKLHRSAGVSARHHDARTAPDPMTPESLASTGTDAPEVPSRRVDGRNADSRSRKRRGGRSSGRGAAGSARTSSAPRRSRGTSGASAGRASAAGSADRHNPPTPGRGAAAFSATREQRRTGKAKRARAGR